jgi:hypothetical protein
VSKPLGSHASFGTKVDYPTFGNLMIDCRLEAPVLAKKLKRDFSRDVTMAVECGLLCAAHPAYLVYALRAYGQYFNEARAHQGIKQRVTCPLPPHSTPGQVVRRDILGGVIHDYFRAASLLTTGWDKVSCYYWAVGHETVPA